MERLVGSHISSAGGYAAMAKQAKRLGANTFAFFTRNPRGGAVKDMDSADVQMFLQLCKQEHYGPLVAHAPYTYNACAAKQHLREFARDSMREDLRRLDEIPENYYNFHPGSHVGQGAEAGVSMIADLLNEVLRPDQRTIVLLETMAGKGSEIGASFEELREVLDRVTLSDKMGVCLDTCHVWDAGYDIVDDLDGVLNTFDRVIGLDRLCAVHCNDSLNLLGTHKDRHARIGEGHIGTQAFARLVRHPALQGVPLILETPNDNAGWAQEIALLREM